MSSSGATGVTTEPASSPRSGGTALGVLLLAGSCLPVLGSVLISPVLPAIRDHFGGGDQVTTLTLVALTIPALFIALGAPVAGILADRVGRRPLLLVALVLYAVVGTAPLWLDSLPAIVGSRALVGVAEAVIITCCTTLIGDHFSGARRDHYLGLQVVVTSLAASVFFGLGGALGGAGWRTPFWAYAVSLVLAVLAFVLLPADRPSSAHAVPGAAPAVGATTVAGAAAHTPWKVIMLPVALTLVSAILFYVVPVHMSLVLDDLGVTASSVIGAVTGVAALATAIGGFLAGRLAAGRVQVLLPIEYAITALGLVLLGLAGNSVALAVVAGIITGVGTGLLLPTLLIWTMGLLNPGQRGSGTGAWSSAFFLGQFLCPLLVLAIGAGEDGLFRGILVLGIVSVVMAAVSTRVTKAVPVPA